MDAAAIFRQGLGSVLPRPPQYYAPRKPQFAPQPQTHHLSADDQGDNDASPSRIAHTLTACCRCRQRKTRCDPALPRCLPCERSGSICEYFDSTKGKKISRFYVVRLQEKVRQLEADLAQYTEEGNEYPRNNEEIVRPGGLVRLNETDETPRYLGPSSGIAMTRLLMEEAKRYTDSKRISELIPDVRARHAQRVSRMQSIVQYRNSVSGQGGRKKSYPMISAHPAQNLPTRPIANKLVDVFNQRVQVFCPVVHEKALAADIDAVFDGDTDPYKNFVVRMVMAISLQKLDTQYAGLADSYYLSAMQSFEDVIRAKDLKTLQCLILTGQYSLLTPTRTAVYYIIGFATRICQQLGLGEEKTITAGYDIGLLDPLTLDMRRRLSWIVTANEFNLAQSMGRPNGFAKGDDLMDVKYFQAVDDEYITEDGIKPGPPSEKKLAAIHFCKMRLLQAEIRRTLYEKKRLEPKHEAHPWFARMEENIREWKDTIPEKPEWCRPWFTGQFHGMIIFLYRPTPQVPQPTSQAALRCFDSASHIIHLQSEQVKNSTVDVTWVFLLNLYTALNAVLWSVSYSDVRVAHTKDELEELVNMTIDIIDQCSERWPDTSSAAQLYTVFAKACLQSYDAPEGWQPPSLSSPPAPSSISPPALPTDASQQNQIPTFDPPQFGNVFGSAPEEMSTGFNFDLPPHPNFRSNSIFHNPGTDSHGRRFSYFPPEFPQPDEGPRPPHEDSIPPSHRAPHAVKSTSPLGSYFTEPASPTTMTPVVDTSQTSIPPLSANDPTLNHISPVMAPGGAIKNETPTPTMSHAPQLPPHNHSGAKSEPPPQGLAGPFQQPPPPSNNVSPSQQLPQQADWFSPPAPFVSPYAFSSGGFWGGIGVNGPGGGMGPDHHPQLLNNNPSPFNAAYQNGAFPGASSSGQNGTASAPPPPQGPSFGFGGPPAPAFPPHMQQHQPQHLQVGGPGSAFAFPTERHGSLSVEQQYELMDVLETEGIGEIDAFLGAGMNIGGGTPSGLVRWNTG